jgi:hypothetical protein
MRCPYGQKMDRLWIRETFAQPFRKIKSSFGCVYRADDDGYRLNPGSMDGKWKPSIFMPRWASRITLEITEVRVERLQSISEEDAKAEGCEPLAIEGDGIDLDSEGIPTFTNGYRDLWDSINGKGSWDANPWVFAISFRVLEKKKVIQGVIRSEKCLT